LSIKRRFHLIGKNSDFTFKEDLRMKGTADCNWGGFMGGALTADLTLDDKTIWHFQGGYAGAVSGVSAAYSKGIGADFPGLDHIDGSCAFEVTAGGLGPSGIQVTFFDLHGIIGTIAGYAFGGGVILGIGGGAWAKR
jgi:hypothetical protein